VATYGNGFIQCSPDGSSWLLRTEGDRATHRETIHFSRLAPEPLERSLPLPDSAGPPGADYHYQVTFAELAPDGRHALLALQRVPRGTWWTWPDRNHIASDPCRLEWWDVEQGRCLAVWNESAEEPSLAGIALTEDARFAVTPSGEGTKVWRVATGTVEHAWPRRADAINSGVIWTPDRRHLVRYSEGELQNGRLFIPMTPVLDIHETNTGRLVQHLELKRNWQQPNQAIPLAFHWETGWLAAKTTDGKNELQCWNLKTGQLWAYWQPHGRATFSAAFSHDGQLLVTASEGTLRLWPLPLLQREVQALERD
jgi:WD40 repeat protein